MASRNHRLAPWVDRLLSQVQRRAGRRKRPRDPPKRLRIKALFPEGAMDLAKPISRRRFAGLLGAGLASTALRPFPVAAATAPAPAEPAGVDSIVRLSSNENPYGPPPAAFDAMRQAFDLAWRYPDEAADALVGELARLHGVGTDQVLLGNGSGEILKICAAAFTGPGRPIVMAEPTFEAIGRYTRAAGGEVISVPLTADYRHDLVRTLIASRFAAGLVYVCNPNN